ncbi:type II toxin-antitoxin system RelE/ParE family toxin [Rhizobium sp. G21]|uniref:type II toxin-antitoxin system RelE/ParE family toxin n=1 Tax=Rhizobium sp. G21 TaxID=2758439 RepID=UPI0016015159|nr:type II toxin-antitoxin system RelE/ParE family toxin [Rhizobium sp. G21]MBB1248581.1 type II toxin-antitoxin system RelE/ParE family toxin [Rhizobium sp. G21]
MQRYEIEIYTRRDGRAPFEIWHHSLKDARAFLALQARVERAGRGDFGDWKKLSGAKGVFEMRISYAQGYRVFYTVIGQKIVLLLAGSTKQEQDKAIAKAIEYFEDYKMRTT